MDYDSGDEMEEDDGDMFADEDLDLQARCVCVFVRRYR